MKRSSRVGRVVTVVASIFIHAAILLGLLLAWVSPTPPAELAAVEVVLVNVSSLFPRPAPSAPAPAKAPKPPPRRAAVRPTPPAPFHRPVVVTETRRTSIGPGMSDAQLSGAANADGAGSGGNGPGGGECNMARRLQAALRKDPLVVAAVSRLAGRAVMVWKGSWVRNEGEDGAGLSAVREAMIWEIGFAPEACRNQSMRGLVIFSFSQGATSGRLVVGADRWKWSDMLGAHAGSAGAGPAEDTPPRP